MQVVILAGGLGTRLKSVTGDLPKSLVNINGYPLLYYQLDNISKAGIKDVVILASYGIEKIRNFCANYKQWDLNISIVEDKIALGTAGAILNAVAYLESIFIVIYGDTIFDIDFNKFIKFHFDKKAAASLLLHPNDHPQDSDIVELNDRDEIIKFHAYPHPSDMYLPNLVNAGMYIMNKSLLSNVVNLPLKPDFGKHYFSLALEQGHKIAGYRSPEYIKDAGTPDRLSKVSKDLKSGLVRDLSLANKRPGIFIDRDGTIVNDPGYIKNTEQLTLIDGVPYSIARLNRMGFRTVLATNQPVIARGECTEKQMNNIHNKLETLLGQEGAYLDRIYYCPHHPDGGFRGERSELKIFCECRKPNIGMILMAASDLNIDLSHSWFIGDSTVDLMTAANAGIKSILVKTGNQGNDEKFPKEPTFEVDTFNDAVEMIANQWPIFIERGKELCAKVAPGDLILIGGLARSGKSTWALILKESLSVQGRDVVIISLDSWIHSAENRIPGQSVLERYDLESADNFILNILNSRTKFSITKYDRKLRKQIKIGAEFNPSSETIFIVEGVPALTLKMLRGYSALNIYVERNEKERIDSMRDDYCSRGVHEEQFLSILQERAKNEIPYILDTKKYANTILNNPREGFF
jgi:D,D-heptose 1,7-bisphosphate phosphatase